jgi:mono/diheme cytochrome c family protein
MRYRWILFAAPFALAALTLGQEKQPAKTPEFRIPEEDVKRENPVKPTPKGLEEAKRRYGIDQCAICHGANGDGKGEIAADLKTKMRDWRDPASLEKMTDGELFYIISKGKGEMTGEEERVKPDQRWQLVNYVRAFAKKDPAAAKKP